MATTNEFGNCSKVHLTLHVPKGRVRPMRKLLKPLLKTADPTLLLTHVYETQSPIEGSDLRDKRDVPKYSVGCELLTTPALSLMAFLPEDGTAEDARESLRQFPWKFHHRIELQNGAFSGGGEGRGGMVSGKQEFYSLSRHYPLCSVCSSPTHCGCTVRFNLFVRNFRAMLEFYRLLTDSEMESTKPDFALFTVNTNNPDFSSYTSSYKLSSSLSTSCSSLSSSSSSSSSLKRKHRKSASSSSNVLCSVQLALKHCPYLEPYPLTSAYLTLFVRNMTSLMTVLPGKAVQFAPNSFLVRDPDGNCVIVHDVEPAFVPRPSKLFNTASSKRRSSQRGSDESTGHVQELVSGKLSSKGSSCCESQDSGRFSDSERGSSELDQCLERLVREVSLNITDYSESSDSDSGRSEHLDLDDSGACLASGFSVAKDKSKVNIGLLQSIRHEKQNMIYL